MLNFYQEPNRDGLTARFSAVEILDRHDRVLVDYIVTRIANVFLTSSAWKKWIIVNVKRGRIVKMVEEKVADELAKIMLEKFK